jgi:hypothetical protein
MPEQKTVKAGREVLVENTAASTLNLPANSRTLAARNRAAGDQARIVKDNPAEYLRHLADRQQDPVLVIQQQSLAAAVVAVGGAKGISVPDVREPFQISLPLYIGATTPSASSEVPHWHPDQAEVYVVLEGAAEILSKYRWVDNGWARAEAQSGDVLVVRPEACHWFRWRSPSGLAMVFKAPQRAGVGHFPAGKVVCNSCPHFMRGCAAPAGFVAST